MKIYKGKHVQAGPCDIFVHEEGKDHPYPLKHIVYHSPDGFQWGYGGSGPADAAFSILTDCLEPEKGGMAWRLHQAFKWEFLATAEVLTTWKVVIYGRRIGQPVDEEVSEIAENSPGPNTPLEALRRIIDRLAKQKEEKG
jgi:hypothetical protein